LKIIIVAGSSEYSRANRTEPKSLSCHRWTLWPSQWCIQKFLGSWNAKSGELHLTGMEYV
jgi:hypothetical protein